MVDTGMPAMRRLGGAVGSLWEPISEERLALYLRLALAIAILTVGFEKSLEMPGDIGTERYHLVAATLTMLAAVPLVLLERTTRLGIVLFTAGLAVYVAVKWAGYHNHGWLTAWTIPVAALFGMRWWDSDLYRWYLRMTLGIAMLAACAQKLLAGTYIDGSYITYLSLHGSSTERLFGFLCCADAANGSCGWHRFLGTFIVVWQAAVGILLIAGLRSIAFLAIEVAFLLGAGLYADEMNFQVLNIALLCIGFGYGMRPWLCAICLALLLVDTYSISAMVDHVL